jgi:hypothetical protein
VVGSTIDDPRSGVGPLRRISRCSVAAACFQRGRRPSDRRASCNADGDPGRFGQGSVQRRAVSERLERIDQLAASTGHLARFVVFGSFVTAEEEPGDVDVVLLMEDTFDLSSVAGEAALVFQHMEADAHFGASVFWTRRSGAIGGEQAMIEYWQVRRDGGRRGIVEIVQEEP